MRSVAGENISYGKCSLEFTPMPLDIAMLRRAASNVYARDAIGSVPICGIHAEWFVEQFLEFCKIKPEAATWAQPEVENIMAGLWILDPEDLI